MSVNKKDLQKLLPLLIENPDWIQYASRMLKPESKCFQYTVRFNVAQMALLELAKNKSHTDNQMLRNIIVEGETPND